MCIEGVNFRLPKVITQKISTICRSYLWYVVYDDCIPGSVGWDSLCNQKDQGGLCFRNISLWNQVYVGKVAWAISQRQDNLWVKWAHTLYVKDKC